MSAVSFVLTRALRPRAEVIQVGQVVSAEEAFDQPVLQRVEGDHAETSSGPQRLLRGPQARVELVQLVVHENAQGLKSLGGHVRRSVESVFARVYDSSWK